jgi:AcrR family transcriptional regulator
VSPIEETKQRIIQAAAQVFGKMGYDGATTRAIAEAASVNEVTLFRHFGNKKNIYMAMIDQYSALPDLRGALEEQMTGNYQEDLLILGTHVMAMMLKRRKNILMSMCAAERLPEIREAVARPPTQQQQMLSGYLREQIASGVVRDLPSPDLAAEMFFGMLFEFAISRPLYAGTPVGRIPAEDAVGQLVDVFVRGTIKPQEAFAEGDR